VLEGIVREVVAELARDLVAETRALHAAVSALARAPGADARERARRAFQRAAPAWKRAQAFRSGPFASSQIFQRAAFWPTNVAAVDALLAAPTAIDEALVEGLGVDARGLWALEYVLFAPCFAEALGAVAPFGARLRSYAQEVAVSTLGYALRLARELGDARRYARAFAAAGQASLNELTAQQLDTLEIVRGKLQRASRAVAERTPLETALEGYFCGRSSELTAALLVGAQRLYLGGLCELVADQAPEVDARVRASFTSLEHAFRALPPSLALAVTARPAALRAALLALDGAQHVLEVEMRAALEA